MNDATAVRYDERLGREGFFGSGNWTFGDATSVDANRKLILLPGTLKRIAGLTLVLAVSSLTSVVDPWTEQRLERSPVTVAAGLRPFAKRRVSAAEARRIVLDILYRTEERRQQAVREEATHGIDWEEIA